MVDEKRQYASWTDDDLADNIKFVNSKTGIIAAKKALNDLHYMLGQDEFSQVCYQLFIFRSLCVLESQCTKLIRIYFSDSFRYLSIKWILT